MKLKVCGIFILTGGLVAAWFWQRSISGLLTANTVYCLSITAGSILFITLMPLIEILWGTDLRLAWRKRFDNKEGITHPLIFRNKVRALLIKTNALLYPLYRKGPGQMLLCWFQEAGYGSQSLFLTIVLIGISSIGSLGGYILTESYLLSGFSAILLLGIFISVLYARAKIHRRLFHDQFPGVLDRLADSLQAGFSLPQALEFFAPSLPEPSASEMNRVFVQMQIGFSVEQALLALYQRRSTEDVRLLVEGITLQRQVGGNMIEMIREITKLIRERVELENEIHTMTAQGRLSAVVIALLVPASLGLLSMFPGYTAVLFGSTIGNLVLISAGLLELIGAVIVLRLIRIEV